MTFVDIYNLITVQCDYFDNQFMDTEKPEQVKMIYSIPNILYQKKIKLSNFSKLLLLKRPFIIDYQF